MHGIGFLLPLILAAVLARSAFGQTPPIASPTSDVVKLEAYSVTGTNIKRLDLEKVLPVTIFGTEAIEARSAVTPVEMLTALPVVVSVPINESNSGSTSSRGDAASIDLRGIGPSNSLILLNGRRLVPSPTSGTANFSPNVNQLPTQGIDHIDVLRDGASSIYGSDAVAGVINYIMKREFRGTELKFRYGYPENGGGQSSDVTLTHGNTLMGGKLRWMTTIDLVTRSALHLRERGFSANADHSTSAPPPFDVPGSPFDLRTGTGNYPSFRIGTATATNYFRPVNGVPTLTSVAPTRAANPEYFLNGNQYFVALPFARRFNTYTGFELDINDRLTAFADVSFYQTRSTYERAPIGFAAPSADQLVVFSADNPFNPYGSRFYNATGAPNSGGIPRIVGTPRTFTLLSEQIKDLHSDWVRIYSQVYRVVGGLRGKLTDDWNWEIGGLYSRARSSEQALYNVRESLFQQAAARTDASAFNPFGYTFKIEGGAVVADQPYVNPPEVMDTFVEEWRRDGLGYLGSIDARISGSAFNLWAGKVSGALGTEYREEQYKIRQPPFASVNPPNAGLDPADNDFIGASPRPDHNGKRDVTSLYAEVVIPLASPSNDFRFVEQLEVTASARHERYSDFGNTTKPKIGMNWRPLRGVMIRASYNEGFTAPNLPLLYSPSQFTAGGGAGSVDPYRNPATREGAYPIRNYQIGNRDLKPTDSRGRSAGIVIDVPKVRGLSLTADYWEISQNNVINSLTGSQVTDNDAALLREYTRQQLASGTPIGSINLGGGTDAYRGDPAVVRYAPTAQDQAAFAAYNAANPDAPLATAGQIVSVSTSFQNLSQGYVAGWDFALNYILPPLAVGNFALNSEWTYLSESHTTFSLPGTAPVVNQRLGVNGNSRNRATTTLSWRKGNWSAGVSQYYIGQFEDTGATTTAAVWESLGRPDYISKNFDGGRDFYRYVVSDVTTYNAYLGYRFPADANRWLKDSSLRLGIINIQDEPPPLATGLFGYSTAVHGAWTFEIKKQF
jgi:iron complex outermembrane recepter protein